jgi:hypothetical protein
MIKTIFKLNKRLIQTGVNSVKNGCIIEHKEKLFTLTNHTQHKSGRSGSIIKFELKDLLTGKGLIERFNSTDQVEGNIYLLKSDVILKMFSGIFERNRISIFISR